MSVCLCVCLCVCVSVCLYVRMYIRLHTCMTMKPYLWSDKEVPGVVVKCIVMQIELRFFSFPDEKFGAIH